MTEQPYFMPGPKRIAATLALVGFPDEVVVTMTAIHGAETSGNVWAVGGPNKDGTYDWGAFQINARYAPQNWADYFVNTQMALPLYEARGFAPWFAYSKIDTVFGLSKHPFWTYRDWAQAGYSQYKAELAKGHPLYRIASCYLLEDGL